jgi:hypothetical protein
MNPILKRILVYLVAIGVVIVVILCKWNDYDVMIENVLLGLFGSLIVFLAIDTVEYFKDKVEFGKLAGYYERIDFKLPDHTKTADSIWMIDNPFRRGVEFKLEYKGHRKYEAILNYPDGDSNVKVTLFAEENDANIGIGHYQYLDKPIADFGTNTFHVDQKNGNRLYVYSKNVVPSGLAEGLEIWKKNRPL